MAVADRQRRPFESGQVDQPRQIGLGFREQPGPAREPSIACRPNGQLRPRGRVRNLGDGVQIHGYVRAFNAIRPPIRSPARPTPTMPWIGLVLELQGWGLASDFAIRKDGWIWTQSGRSGSRIPWPFSPMAQSA